MPSLGNPDTSGTSPYAGSNQVFKRRGGAVVVRFGGFFPGWWKAKFIKNGVR